MDNIIEPNDSFDFSLITLAHPVGIQGGAYFTKIEYNKTPVYIQTSKGISKQGFVKSGKKYYCDLMFDKSSVPLIHWFENLEEKCQKLIFEKKDTWFQGSLEETDIETAFNPVIRLYKSGKYYLMRTNIKNSKTDTPTIKIYNEKEMTLSIDDIKPETEIMCIAEIQGIKFTTRNFQIEIELKQVMVLDNDPIFENCLIKTNKPYTKPDTKLDTNTILEKNHILELENNTNNLEENDTLCLEKNDTIDLEKTTINNTLLNGIVESVSVGNVSVGNVSVGNNEYNNTEGIPDLDINIDFENLNEDIQEDVDDGELKEIEINEEELGLDSMTLKKPNEVYFDLYKIARNKAKEAKKNAIIAYLEAKNIKKTYMIDNMDDTDSDIDADIDNVSESELDSF